MENRITIGKRGFCIFFVAFAFLLSCATGRVQSETLYANEPVCEVIEDVIYEIPEIRAEFPGGMTELMNFINREMFRYVPPFISPVYIPQGRVFVQFVIRKDGSITDIEVIRSSDPIFNREAIRIVEAMPKWTPAKNNGEKVNSRFAVPISFRPFW